MLKKLHYLFTLLLFISIIFSTFYLVNQNGVVNASDNKSSIKDLNDKILKLNKDYSSSKNKSTLDDMINASKDRKDKLSKLISSDTKTFLELSFSKNVKDNLPKEVKDYVEDNVSLTGKLSFAYADDLKNKKAIELFSLKTKDQNLSLYFDNSNDLSKYSLKDVSVNGIKLDNSVAVAYNPQSPNVTLASTTSVTTSSLPVSVTPATKKIAVMLFNFQDSTSQSFTQDQFRAEAFTKPGSSVSFWKEESFGNLTVTGKIRQDGDVYGYFTVPYTASADCTQMKDTWADSVDQMATASGIDITGYDSIVYAFTGVSTSTNCSWGGMAYVPGSRAWINTSDPSAITSLVAHEVAHNWGLMHASSYNCTDANGVRVSISSNCTIDEYGDPFDKMGAWNDYHYNTFNKGRLNQIKSSNVATVNSSGTYTLSPMEYGTANLQSIAIPRSKDTSGNVLDYYYVEYRQPSYFDNFLSSSPVTNGVSIRIAPDFSTIKNTWLIDTTPSTTTFDDAALGVGKTFTDSIAGISIRTINTNSNGAVVDVNFISPTCVRANPTVNINPISKYGSKGQSQTYTLYLTNNDSSSCSASNFNVTSTLPSGWSQNPSNFTQSILPSSTTSVNVTVTPSSTAADGAYSVNEKITNSSNTSLNSSDSSKLNIFTPANLTCSPTYLSDIQWNTMTNGWGPVEKDHNVGGNDINDGGTITMKGVSYLKGLGTNSSSEIRYKLGGKYLSFNSDIGLDDDTSGNGSVVFQVYLDGALAYDSGLIVSSSSTKNIKLDLTGVDELRLIVNDGGDNNYWDHGNWANAQVNCSDIQAPLVSITSPGANSRVKHNSTITIKATASDNVAVQKVEFYVNNVLKCSTTTTPYSCNWIVPNSSGVNYTLMAKSYDKAGNTSTNSINVTSY